MLGNNTSRAFFVALVAFTLTACDPTFLIERTLTFEGALSKACLEQSAIAINAEFSEKDDDIETSPFPYRFNLSGEDGNFESFTWVRGEMQQLESTYFQIGHSSRASELSYCEFTSDYFNAVAAECMLQPDATEIVEVFDDASC